MDRSGDVKKEVVFVDANNTEPEVRRQQKVIHDQDAQRRVLIGKVTSFIWLAFGVLDVLLLFRFALKLIGANPENTFADFVYQASDLFVKPFVGLVESPTSGDMVLDIPVLVAVIVYTLAAWVLVRLVWLLFYHPGKRVISTYYEAD